MERTRPYTHTLTHTHTHPNPLIPILHWSNMGNGEKESTRGAGVWSSYRWDGGGGRGERSSRSVRPHRFDRTAPFVLFLSVCGQRLIAALQPQKGKRRNQGATSSALGTARAIRREGPDSTENPTAVGRQGVETEERRGGRKGTFRTQKSCIGGRGQPEGI
ncbi:unnamed protein product [Boreogadus saida]